MSGCGTRYVNRFAQKATLELSISRLVLRIRAAKQEFASRSELLFLNTLDNQDDDKMPQKSDKSDSLETTKTVIDFYCFDD